MLGFGLYVSYLYFVYDIIIIIIITQMSTGDQLLYTSARFTRMS